MSGTQDRARVGVVIAPNRVSAGMVVGESALAVPLPDQSGAGLDPARLIRVLSSAARGSIGTITIDFSQVLLAALTHAEPRLPSVAVIRIVPQRATDAVLAGSPTPLVERLVTRRFTVPGGHDLLGNELRSLDRAALVEVCAELAASEIRHVAIVGAGSQTRPQHERAVADAVQAAVPNARISAASDFGGSGLVSREATVVYNVALMPLTERLLGRFEAAVAEQLPTTGLVVARGDGGHSTSARVRALPVVAIGATESMELAGAARSAGYDDCRVRLFRPGGRLAGTVRHGLPVVGPAEVLGLATELVVPTAVLAWEPDRARPEATWVTDVPVVDAGEDSGMLAGIGAAMSRPTAWLDEVAFIESAAQLADVLRGAEQRAIAITTANGAAPGTTQVVEQSVVAVPYSPYGTVRIRLLAAGTEQESVGPPARVDLDQVFV
jgi:Hydantoinase/oxoprolinase N-terminal region